WIKSADSPVWQRHFRDTQLRRSESYDQKWTYVVENPVLGGLVARSEDWAFQGELNELRWWRRWSGGRCPVPNINVKARWRMCAVSSKFGTTRRSCLQFL